MHRHIIYTYHIQHIQTHKNIYTDHMHTISIHRHIIHMHHLQYTHRHRDLKNSVEGIKSCPYKGRVPNHLDICINYHQHGTEQARRNTC